MPQVDRLALKGIVVSLESNGSSLMQVARIALSNIAVIVAHVAGQWQMRTHSLKQQGGRQIG